MRSGYMRNVLPLIAIRALCELTAIVTIAMTLARDFVRRVMLLKDVHESWTGSAYRTVRHAKDGTTNVDLEQRNCN